MLPLFDRLFYHPTRQVYNDPAMFGLRFEPAPFPSDGLTLDGWFFPASGPRCAGTVVHCHGNAGNITAHFLHVGWLPAAGWNLFCFDYRGYGRSEGHPSRAGLIADAHAAIDYVKTRPDVDPRRVTVLGQSLGGAVGIVAAAERGDIAALAVEGAFSHYRRIAAWHMRRNPLLWPFAGIVPRLFMTRGHDPIDHVSRVAPTPLLIIHGCEDDVVPSAMAEELYAAACEPKQLWLIDGVGHYAAFEDLADIARPRLLRFFSDAVGSLTAEAIAARVG